MFNRFFIVVSVFSISFVSAQTVIPEKIERRGDTLNITIGNTLIKQARKPWAAGIAFGYGTTAYAPQTESWLGNHGAGVFQLLVRYKPFELDGAFRLATVNPQKSLAFGPDTLDSFAKLNPVKLDFLLGYGFRPTEHILLMPQIGYAYSVFNVINEDVLKKHFNISSVSGFALGGAVSIILPISFTTDLEFRIGAHYHIADYSSVHPSLDRNYWTFDFGISLLEWLTTSEQFRISE